MFVLKNTSVKECMVSSVSSMSWVLGFVRDINDYDNKGITSLLAKLEEVPHT